MPLREMLEHDHSFGPDEIALLTTAYEDCLVRLKLTHRQDGATALVAKAIFEAAKGGERDPDRLCDAAMKVLSN
jgi:hypothetical protein